MKNLFGFRLDIRRFRRETRWKLDPLKLVPFTIKYLGLLLILQTDPFRPALA